jgi:predicted Rossmann fold flavoprotein
LASGNGRCNISNSFLSVDDYFGSDPSFVKFALNEFGFGAFEKFCKSLGLLLEIKDDGRAYPLSNEAKSVALLFEQEARLRGVNFILDVHVKEIKKVDDFFVIRAETDMYKDYSKVLICAGSEAYPSLGASDDGYEIAKKFNHEIVAPYPSLVGLHLNSDMLVKIAGVKVDGIATLFIDGKSVQSVSSDILFTSYGVSGFAILDISQRASHALLYDQSSNYLFKSTAKVR